MPILESVRGAADMSYCAPQQEQSTSLVLVQCRTLLVTSGAGVNVRMNIHTRLRGQLQKTACLLPGVLLSMPGVHTVLTSFAGMKE